MLTFCQIQTFTDRPPAIVSFDKKLTDGDYELRRGDKVYRVALKNGEWTHQP